MILDQLLGDVPRRRFMEEHFLKLPFSRAGGCEAWMSCSDCHTLDRLLGATDADVIVGAGGTQFSGTRPTSAESARPVLAAGNTIGIRRAQRHDPALAALAAEFEAAFCATIDLHWYVTPANHCGFGWHYDAEEVFVLQLRGSKEWSLRKNTVHPWPLVETLPQDMRYDREIMPLYRCKLDAGDWLYVPSGYWHKTETGPDESVSLSIGVLAPTAMDVYDFLRPRLVASLRWRQRLGCFGTAGVQTQQEQAEALGAAFRDLGEDLASLLSDESLPWDFLAAWRAQHSTAQTDGE